MFFKHHRVFLFWDYCPSSKYLSFSSVCHRWILTIYLFFFSGFLSHLWFWVIQGLFRNLSWGQLLLLDLEILPSYLLLFIVAVSRSPAHLFLFPWYIIWISFWCLLRRSFSILAFILWVREHGTWEESGNCFFVLPVSLTWKSWIFLSILESSQLLHF